jgi:hypothetical protein
MKPVFLFLALLSVAFAGAEAPIKKCVEAAPAAPTQKKPSPAPLPIRARLWLT